MGKSNNRVAAVLVTYNRVELLQRAIKSLLEQSVAVDYIVVVNNNSTDGTRNYLDDIHDSKIKSIHLPVNTGGAGGFNAGMSYAHELNVDFIWIMDDDAIATPYALSELINSSLMLSEKMVDWGFLCSHVLSDDGECMNVPSISSKVNSTGYLDWPAFACDGVIGVDKATFVSVFLKTETVSQVGLPLKEMFIWGDDTEYTWRISNHFKCYYVSKSIVYHKRVLARALSLREENNTNRIKWFGYLFRNNIYNIRRYGNAKELLLYIFFIFRVFIGLLFKPSKYKFTKIKVLAGGLIHGFTFNPKVDFPKLRKF
ncbi:TPA: glycosyltransferase family 2 protein [Klebsiella pneumoniae]|nr:glycosyltransferase family 2 protein [Klebsiella pneumoniae]